MGGIGHALAKTALRQGVGEQDRWSRAGVPGDFPPSQNAARLAMDGIDRCGAASCWLAGLLQWQLM